MERSSDELERISCNYQRVLADIEKHRCFPSIRLVCVTKYASQSQVLSLLRAGAIELGENLLPSARDRFLSFAGSGYTFTRHLLGPQQSRKVRLIPDSCDLFQALCSTEAAALLNECLAEQRHRLCVTLQVNIDNDPRKSGWNPGAIQDAVSEIATSCPHLVLRGLMCITRQPEATEDMRAIESRSRESFARMRIIFDTIAASSLPLDSWDTLSMGMSLDFTWALAEGSTMVRVGSALFA